MISCAVIILENLQWCDKQSLGYLPRVINDCPGKLFLFTFRPCANALANAPEIQGRLAAEIGFVSILFVSFSGLFFFIFFLSLFLVLICLFFRFGRFLDCAKLFRSEQAGIFDCIRNGVYGDSGANRDYQGTGPRVDVVVLFSFLFCFFSFFFFLLLLLLLLLLLFLLLMMMMSPLSYLQSKT
jgi:hypothetical protein